MEKKFFDILYFKRKVFDMSEIHLTGQNAGQVNQNTSVSGSISVNSNKGSSSHDTMAVIGGAPSKKWYQVVNPELVPAGYILWIHHQDVLLQKIGDKGEIESVGVKSAGAALFILQIQNQFAQICINVLTAWNKQIAEDNKRMREEENSKLHQRWEEEHLGRGYEAWLNTLSSQERFRVLEYPYLDRKIEMNGAISATLTGYISAVRADPKAAETLPFLTATVTLGSPFRYEYLPDAISTHGITPMRDASVTSATDYAAIWLGGSMGQSLAMTTAAHMIPQVGKTTEKVIDNDYAKQYAASLVGFVNGDGFVTLAQALFVGQTENGVPISEERMAILTRLLKASILSTAVGLLYYTDTGVAGKGGGMTGKEFVDLISNKIDLTGSDPQLIGFVRTVQELVITLPDSDRANFFAGFSAFFDTHKVNDWVGYKHVYAMMQYNFDLPAVAA